MSELRNQPPTPRRLRDARRKGDVAASADVPQAATFVVMLAVLWLGGPWLYAQIQLLWQQAVELGLSGRPVEPQQLGALAVGAAKVVLVIALPVTGLTAAAAALASLVQVGPLAAWTRIVPDVSHLNPAAGLKRIVSTRNLIELLKMVVKIALLGAVLLAVLRMTLDDLVTLVRLQPEQILQAGARILLRILGWAAVVYLLMAGVDVVHAKYEFMRRNRMSVDEVRRDHKDEEGDPLNRGRRRSAHYEAVYAGLADRIAYSAAVIESPQSAVALAWAGPGHLPLVAVRGREAVARRIVDLARQALVPVVDDAALAERLYEIVREGQPIPRALFEDVARAMRWATGLD